MHKAHRQARQRQLQEEELLREIHYRQSLPTVTRKDLYSNGSKKFGLIVASPSCSSSSSEEPNFLCDDENNDDENTENSSNDDYEMKISSLPDFILQKHDMKNLECSGSSTNEMNPTETIVRLQCRVHSNRGSGKLHFLILREGIHFVLATLFTTDKEMIHFVKKITPESIVEVFGKVCTAENEITERVISGKFKTMEIKIERIYILSLARGLPFTVQDYMVQNFKNQKTSFVKNVSTENQISNTQLLDHRVISLRIPCQLAIFKIQSSVTKYFRQFMEQLEFVEIHTPKLSTCQRPYQGRDLMKVYEVGPVFRKDAGTTYRHLTEFTSLDFEMVIQSHYLEIIHLVEKLLNSILTRLETEMAQELTLIRQEQEDDDSEKLLSISSTSIVTNHERTCLVISYHEAIALLNNYRQEHQNPLEEIFLPQYGLSTHDTQKLSQIIRDTFHRDLFILYRFPSSLKSYHVMKPPSIMEEESMHNRLSNSFEVYLRGQCIGSGYQSIHDHDMLKKECEKCNGMEWCNLDYLKYGTWPHAGCSFGLERFVMAYLGLGNVRRSSLFPRDSHRMTP
ncbi:hypothetical protein C9374_007860 [Naegleria lovaniensis]|uniref:Aminoacyl-transfer RNA synthetases class-II family profile domain-containing protein n=1 Tax=Naegleria lovaniensis TaxID=51637 RepID=A0AA88GFW5_NAELO|nr:uncharacterized protein C9374_007860 [Naegleria lovaniensis]KAG2378712.1 hypothetical protein C9374_007860 [Naegleria lovaniensis]